MQNDRAKKLTDDCGPCYSCAKLAELMAENNALRGIVGDLKAPTDPGEASMMSVDAFIEKQTEHESHDNREKLEADVERLIGKIQERIFSGRDAGALRFQIRELLDRHAAITEREWIDTECAKCGARENERDRDFTELQAKVDELTEQLETAHAKNRALKSHIAKMQEGRHGWHVKGVELQREVDRLTRENVSLARDLGECMAERDELREKLSAALGHAHETLALVDMDGNVVS